MHKRIAATAALAMLAGCEGGGAPAEQNNLAEANAAAAAPAPASAEDRAALARLLPDYPGATQVRRSDGAGGAAGGVSGSLAFRTGDPTYQVARFYADVARGEGFTVDGEPGESLMVTMTANREGGGLVSLSATRIGPNTEVQIMASTGTR